MLFSVISVVFLAGCARGGGEAPTGAGVVITSFVPDLQEVEGGTSVSFTALVKNIGEKPATSIKALLFGLSSGWTGTDFTSGATKDITSLSPPDPKVGLAGEESTLDWTITAPAAKDVDLVYDAQLRVFYSYTTEATTLVRFVTSDYLKTNPNIQKGIVSSTVSSGALSIVSVARTPTVTSASTTGKIQFDIQNIGGGRVFKTLPGVVPIEARDIDLIEKIEITNVERCDGTAKAGSPAIVTLDNKRMVSGKSRLVTCEVNTAGIGNFVDKEISVKITYKYYVDSATSVTVPKALA